VRAYLADVSRSMMAVAAGTPGPIRRRRRPRLGHSRAGRPLLVYPRVGGSTVGAPYLAVKPYPRAVTVERVEFVDSRGVTLHRWKGDPPSVPRRRDLVEIDGAVWLVDYGSRVRTNRGTGR
jgi:hypothetical protein